MRRFTMVAIATITTGLNLSSPNAWAITLTEPCKTKPVVIAVIDTGIDLQHPKLKPFIWSNPGEIGFDSNGRDKSNNQIDDDANGFVDDVHGWNFANHNHQLQDIHGHGSHIAGLVVGVTRKNFSLPKPKDCNPLQLMVLKYYDAKLSPHETLEASTAAIRYAVKNHAHIINFSSGGFDRDEDEQNAVEFAEQHHVLIVAAAGNNHDNNDAQGFFPASYKTQNILAVAALNRDGRQLVKSSNYGTKSVHIAAPGQDLVSTLPGGGMGTMTGTSQATAYVTGVIAQMIQRHPHMLDPAEIIKHFVNTATLDQAFRERTISGGKVNASLALSLKGTDRDAFGYRNINSIEASLLNLSTDVGTVSQTATVNSTSQAPLLKQRP